MQNENHMAKLVQRLVLTNHRLFADESFNQEVYDKSYAEFVELRKSFGPKCHYADYYKTHKTTYPPHSIIGAWNILPSKQIGEYYLHGRIIISCCAEEVEFIKRVRTAMACGLIRQDMAEVCERLDTVCVIRGTIQSFHPHKTGRIFVRLANDIYELARTQPIHDEIFNNICFHDEIEIKYLPEVAAF